MARAARALSAPDIDALQKQITLVNHPAGRKVELVAAISEDPELALTIDGASTLTITVADHKRQFINDDTIDQRSWAVVAGIYFELVAVSKSGDYLTLTLEDSIVAALRRQTKPLSVGANKTTRRAFAIRLAKEAGVSYAIDPGHPEKVHNPLTRSHGGDKQSSWDILGSDVAEPINWRRFSDGSRLVLGGDDWLKSGYMKPVVLQENVGGVQSIDFDLDVGKRASTATVGIDTRLLSFTPGAPVSIPSLGPGSGLWITSTFTRRLSSTNGTLELTRARHVLKEPKAQSSGRGRNKGHDSGDPNYVPGQNGSDTGGRASNPARERMVRFALAQKGKAYVWGGNGPDGYDCSGLVQAATRAAGKTLGKPAASQWATCKAAGKTIPVHEALKIRGALLFRIGVGDYNHVVISLGNGTTVEARGTGYGCGVFGGAASRGWTGAALWV
ncbi:hypothetical protein GCM10028801_41300 [Nocardioides maradonensis]